MARISTKLYRYIYVLGNITWRSPLVLYQCRLISCSIYLFPFIFCGIFKTLLYLYFSNSTDNDRTKMWLCCILYFLEIRCGAPSSIGNTTHQVNRDGVHTEYKCLPNYELEDGELMKVCGDNGTWFGEDPICVGE